MPTLKARYVIKGIRWMPMSHAAKEIGTDVAGIRKLMAHGTLEWCPLRAGSLIFLVEEAAAIRIGLERRSAKRANSHAPRTPPKKKAFKAPVYKYTAPPSIEGRHPVAGPTWDPAGGVRPTLPPLDLKRKT